jgi:hypothetical protein
MLPVNFHLSTSYFGCLRGGTFHFTDISVDYSWSNLILSCRQVFLIAKFRFWSLPSYH